MNQVDQKFFESKRISKDYWIATGRINKQKNYPMMIEGFRKFVDIFPDEKLRIYGKGDDVDCVKNIINDNDLNKNVFLMGQTDNVLDVLAHAKGFFLTSDYEGMPNGLLEAPAMGIPSIATDCPCGGPRQVVSNNINGILVPVNDSDAFFKAIINLEDEETNNAISLQARERAKDFTPDVVFEKWNGYINKIAESV